MNVYAMKTKETDIAITKEVDVKKKECSRCQKWSKIARFSSVDCVSQNTKLVKVACQQNICWLCSHGKKTLPRETCHGKLVKETYLLTHSHGQVKTC